MLVSWLKQYFVKASCKYTGKRHTFFFFLVGTEDGVHPQTSSRKRTLGHLVLHGSSTRLKRSSTLLLFLPPGSGMFLSLRKALKSMSMLVFASAQNDRIGWEAADEELQALLFAQLARAESYCTRSG